MKLSVTKVVKKFTTWYLNIHYSIHNSSSLDPILSHLNAVHTPYLISLKSILYYQPTWVSGTVVTSFQVYQPKFCMHFLTHLWILYSPPNPPSFRWSP